MVRNAYVLSFACLLLTGAALGDGFGRRRLFVLGIAAFSPAGPVFPGLPAFLVGHQPHNRSARPSAAARPCG
ncbi:hypothetical protein [Streptomyces sp. RK31]|uniref:hypothetical protein n=1 Tax=Streptomyces sp. RK31 TaxID=2824892 RepID=UPI001FFDC894|nr:hypothetical protein [Streptomyces sp. RK31]